jgi:phytanoyl-CoA hydroxylase
MLTPDQIDRFATDGCLVLPGFWSPETVRLALDRAHAMLDAVDADAAAGVFTTGEHGHDPQAAFLRSAHTVQAFLEEEAIDAAGRLTRPAARAVNKFGHALHRLDPVFSALSHGPRLAGLARALGLPRPQLRQSMLIVKQPGIGGEVRWHQDESYFHTEPASTVGLWFALEDADAGNGCLWIAPGGHRGPLRERFVVDGDGARLLQLDATPWPSSDAATPLPVTAGTLVVLHGRLPHRSDANRSDRSRLAYTLHVTDAGSAYAAGNWLQPDPRDPPEPFDDPSARWSARPRPAPPPAP